MTAWSQARRLGQQSRTAAQVDRLSTDIGNVALPYAEKRFSDKVCIYCRSRSRSKVGFLPITGPVVFCKDHQEQYAADKVWEEKHKREMGMA